MLDDLRNTITALALPSLDVAVTGYAQQSDEVPPSGGDTSVRMLSGLYWSDFQFVRHGTSYTLDATDIAGIEYFVQALGQLDSHPSRAGIEVALRRFTSHTAASIMRTD